MRPDRDIDGVYEIFSVPIDGSSAPTKLNYPLIMTGERAFPLGVTADSRRVIFWENSTSFGSLYGSAPIEGGALPIPLSPARTKQLWGLQLAPDGSRVVTEQERVLCDHELLSVSVDQTFLAESFLASYTFNSCGFQNIEFKISPDSETVAYIPRDGAGSKLHSVPLNGSAGPTLVSSSGTSGGYLYDFEFTPDGDELVYVAQQNRSATNVYVAPLDGSSPPTRSCGAPAGQLGRLLVRDRPGW